MKDKQAKDGGLLQERIAIVTGAARGIGFAIARRFLNEGASVALVDQDEQRVHEAAFRLGAQALGLAVDVTDPSAVRTMVEECLERWRRLDILVNNAGIAGMAGPLVDYPFDDWQRVLAVNLNGVFLCTQAVLPELLKNGYGRIVNVASISGKEGNPNMAAYSTSKGGVIAFTKAVGKELAENGVLVNCVTPAVIRTEILDQLTPEAVDYMVSKIPMKRTGEPREAAALVAWLASEECSFSTGAVFDLSGGRATY
jgi:3-oxoacyl-[acyl-carrier protein] reductase